MGQLWNAIICQMNWHKCYIPFYLFCRSNFDGLCQLGFVLRWTLVLATGHLSMWPCPFTLWPSRGAAFLRDNSHVHSLCFSSILFIVLFSLLLRLERWRASLGAEASLIAVGLLLFTWRSAQLDLRGLMLVELAALCTGLQNGSNSSKRKIEFIFRCSLDNFAADYARRRASFPIEVILDFSINYGNKNSLGIRWIWWFTFKFVYFC